MDWLKAIAPTVASALGGPLAGLAVGVLGKAMGWEESTQEKVTDLLKSGNMTGDQVAAIKVAELELKKHESDNGFKFAELEIRDRASAREMQVQTRSKIPGVLAIAITLGFFGILIGMMLGTFKAAENSALLIMLGSLGTAWASVIAYYFGSTAGSAAKSELLARAPALK